MYNLQVPITTELADKLKELAAEEEDSLRKYCRKILKNYVKNLERSTEIKCSKEDTIIETKREEYKPEDDVFDIDSYDINF